MERLNWLQLSRSPRAKSKGKHIFKRIGRGRIEARLLQNYADIRTLFEEIEVFSLPGAGAVELMSVVIRLNGLCDGILFLSRSHSQRIAFAARP